MTGFVLKTQTPSGANNLNGRCSHPTGARRNVFSNRRYLKLT